MEQSKSDLQVALKLCSEARLSRYLRATNGNENLAILLCKQNHAFAGTLHQQIGYVEIAVRNTIDRALRQLSLQENGSELWTEEDNAPTIIYKIIRAPIANARKRAYKKHGSTITHDDVVSNLMWGTWIKLVGEDIKIENELQRQLWQTALANAFPNVTPDENGRKQISRNLCYLREIRNRAAHFDNLDDAAKHKRRIINASLFLLHAIDDDFTHGWFDPAAIRNAVKQRDAILANLK
ncbi:hypothetical protein OZX62_08150 [Bifidobacterium sp. ESL0690]|uniref:hypothetical protein n=1 Tax=Bifidobacterium sp. ESL0690 TaxID=2983214 RepID=UPI0023F788F1|nr:hypothetical protein [Bifidobacterium sp. ESL0690]WEV46400.1 hypothetical protein OZX62_08150 [Bifidobacterium sp. ESL0690]